MKHLSATLITVLLAIQTRAYSLSELSPRIWSELQRIG